MITIYGLKYNQAENYFHDWRLTLLDTPDTDLDSKV